MIEIETAQEILVRLAFSTVLRHRQAGSGFEEFARTRDRERERGPSPWYHHGSNAR
jgi:hypothetical protein